MTDIYSDRYEAGRLLADKLLEFKDNKETLILALPRGGIVIGYQIARRLSVPLDIFITHKLGYPGQPELAIGAVSETGSVIINRALADEVDKQYVNREIAVQRQEISRRVTLYRGGGKALRREGKSIILVDDGLATGATARAAIEALRIERPKQLIVAVPVAPEETSREFEKLVDQFICLQSDPFFYAVGLYYRDFNQVTDEEVTYLLRKAGEELES